MSNLFTFLYWFDYFPAPFIAIYFWLFEALFGIAVVAGIVLIRLKDKNTTDKLKNMYFTKLIHWLISFGLVGLVLTFFKQQRAVLLGMRVWLILWLVICLVWLGFILKYIFIDVPKLKKEKENQKEFRKYLP